MNLINRGQAAKRYKVNYSVLKALQESGVLRTVKRGRYFYYEREQLEAELVTRGLWQRPGQQQKQDSGSQGEEQLEKFNPDGKTKIKNSCGHVWSYRIRRESAVEWLKGRPCPKCARDGGMGKQDPPPGENENFDSQEEEEAPPPPPPPPEPEPDPEFVEAVMARLPVAALYHASLPDLTLLLQAGVPVWLQGPPGTSKSTLADQAAQALKLGFYPQSCHEMMTRTDLFGYRDASGNEHRTPFWDAYELGGVLLLDEVDNGNPNLLAALNSALSNGHCVFGSGTVVERHPDFRVVATANTAGLGPEAGFIGRLGVDLATRDRFVSVTVPIDNDLEAALAALYSGDEDLVGKAREACAIRARKVAERRSREAKRAPTSEKIVAAVRIVRDRAARGFEDLVVSPRTTIHVAAMVRVGFTLIEAFEAKLTGLKADEVAQLCDGIETN